jgi:hypothetical protein
VNHKYIKRCYTGSRQSAFDCRSEHIVKYVALIRDLIPLELSGTLDAF